MHSTQIINLLIATLPSPESIRIGKISDAPVEAHSVSFTWHNVQMFALSSQGTENVDIFVPGRDPSKALSLAVEALIKAKRSTSAAQAKAAVAFEKIKASAVVAKFDEHHSGYAVLLSDVVSLADLAGCYRKPDPDDCLDFTKEEATRDDRTGLGALVSALHPDPDIKLPGFRFVGAELCQHNKNKARCNDCLSSLIDKVKESTQAIFPTLQVGGPNPGTVCLIYNALRRAHRAIEEAADACKHGLETPVVTAKGSTR